MYDLYLDIYDRYFKGDRAGAIEAHNFILPILNHIRQNVEMIIFYEKRILKRRGWIDCDRCRAPYFRTDAVYDRLFDELYRALEVEFLEV